MRFLICEKQLVVVFFHSWGQFDVLASPGGILQGRGRAGPPGADARTATQGHLASAQTLSRADPVRK